VSVIIAGNVLRVSVNKVNIISVELDHGFDDHGFRNVESSVGARLGARRIGAAVYEAEEGRPIWPYHYHYGIEEWLYVIAGAPVLREAAGQRVMTPGDLVCFPAGHRGAHTMKGPGRFVILDAGRDVEPYGSVYPDSGKISGPEGMHLLSSAVGYWHGEGTAGAQAARETDRRREPSPPLPVVNALTAPLGRLFGADRLDATLSDGSEPYHYVHGRESWLLVLAGTPTLRHPAGEDELEPGDLVCFPDGPAGAHQLLARGETVRVLRLSTTGLPANVFHPDTGQWRLHHGPDETVVL
jgi:uncharacterized cupin superfamily protein